MFRDFAGRTMYYINQMLSMRITYERQEPPDQQAVSAIVRNFDGLLAAQFPVEATTKFINTLRDMNETPTLHFSVQAFLEELATMQQSLVADAQCFNRY